MFYLLRFVYLGYIYYLNISDFRCSCRAIYHIYRLEQFMELGFGITIHKIIKLYS